MKSRMKIVCRQLYTSLQQVIICVAVLCISYTNATAQSAGTPAPLPSTPSSGTDTKVEIGYTATFLINNPALNNIFTPSDTSYDAYVTGSKMIGAQSGISARLNFEMGAGKRFIVPLGVDMTFFRGYQRMESNSTIGRGSVSANVTSLVAGIQYRMIELPLARAFLYGGIEARGSFVPGPTFSYIVENKETGQIDYASSIQDTTIKPSVFRFGGAARVGVQGRLYDQLRINISCAYGVMNLFGRDLRTSSLERRSELLTPTQIGETIEQMTHFMHFSIWFQYRI